MRTFQNDGLMHPGRPVKQTNKTSPVHTIYSPEENEAIFDGWGG